MSTEYHKIQSLFLRDPLTNYKTFLPEYTLPEFKYLENNVWSFDEKVDGTNIRVTWDGETVSFDGRSDTAQIPGPLVKRLIALFPPEKFKTQFPDCVPGSGIPVVLYGEGYGAGIQKGGGDYGPVNFILFDVFYGIWLLPEAVTDIGLGLGLDRVPTIGTGTLLEAVELVKGGFPSLLKKSEPEGIVMRPLVPLFTRSGERIISKLKARDFPKV